jgi:hypothetical protein
MRINMEMITLLLLAAAVSSIAFTITTTGIFLWLIELVSPIHKKIEDLIHCPWCLGHWITFVILLLPGIGLYPYTGIKFLDFFLTAFTIIGLSGLAMYVLLRAFEPVAKAMGIRERVKIQNARRVPNDIPE